MATGERPDVDDERDRYRELLAELRTIIPGVQVLFAFLLTVPFSARFEALDGVSMQVFALSLVSVGVAAVVLMTPAIYHRLTPRHDRQRRIRLGVRVTVAGMALLAVAMGSSVFVVSRLIFEVNPEARAGNLSPTTMGIVVCSLVAGTALFLWFVLPLLRRGK